MDNFSWSDSVQAAFSTCMPCIRRSPVSLNDSSDNDISYDHSAQRIRRALPDELAGLLTDTDTDVDAETLSLHSNIGDATRRRKKKRKGRGKHISVFGWHLFGKPPIQLPEGDDDEIYHRHDIRTRTISSSTVDSDAPTIDPAVIASLTSPQLQERALAVEAEGMRHKEERRERRRARKYSNRAALSLDADDEDFEGFQGSGSGDIAASYTTPPPSAAGFVHVIREDVQEDADADDADLGGELYARRTRQTDGSNGSDSRSRTSASQSNLGEGYHRPYTTQQQPRRAPHMVPLPPPSDSSSVPRMKKSKKRGSTKPPSSSTTSQSASLPSPVSSTFSHPVIRTADSPNMPGLSSPALEGYGNDAGAFPSVGFGGGGHGKTRNMGAFLATRGDAAKL